MNPYAAAQRQRVELAQRSSKKVPRRKRRAPELPKLPQGIDLAKATEPGVNYFEKFKNDLKGRKYNREQRRKVMRDISGREQRLMATLAPDPLALDSRICGSCLRPMSEHPKPDYYPCPEKS